MARSRKSYGSRSRAASVISAATALASILGSRKRSSNSSTSTAFKTPKPARKQQIFARRVAGARRARSVLNTRQLIRAAKQKNYKTNTTGRYVGRLRRGWRKPYVKNLQKGVEYTMENRGTIDDANAVYVGHSIASMIVVKVVARAIVKAIFLKAGIDITDFDNVVPMSATNKYRFFHKYIKDVTSTSTYVTDAYDIVSGNTFNQVADNFVDRWEAAVTDGTPTSEGPWQIMRIVEFGLLSGTGEPYEALMARIDGSALYINFDFVSTLQAQNQTLGANGADTNDELTTNIENNPLKGKVYKSRKASNGLTTKWKPNTSTPGFTNLIADKDTGLITQTATDLSDDLYKKPPQGFFFNSTAQANCMLQPGQIKHDTIKFSRKMYVDRFMQIFTNAVWRAANQSTPFVQCWVPFGFAHVVGMEKLLDSGSSEQNIRLGFEVTSTYRAKVDIAKSVTVPTVVTGL